MTGLPRSFIDVLFILLLGTIVMLAESVPVGRIDAELLEMGGGGVSPVAAHEVEVVFVTEDGLHADDRMWPGTGELAATLPPGAPVLLIASGADVRHRRVITIWSDFDELGFDVNLAASTGGTDSPPEN